VTGPPEHPRYNTATVARSYQEAPDPDPQPDEFDRFRQAFAAEASTGAAGECAPPLDVIETAAGVEIVMDLPGVAAADLRVLFSQGTLIVAGRKLPGPCGHREAVFHLAERTFGRFVRAIRLSGAFDAGRASATLAAGELRLALPRIEERRGRDIRIPVTDAGSTR
jgi:HSP20 family protein